MAGTVVKVGAATVSYLHEDPASAYALLSWDAPPGTPSPPLHVHHRTDEGFYVVSGVYRFRVGADTVERTAGGHVFVPAGVAHTFWNAASDDAVALLILTPPDFAAYFRELSIGLASATSDDAAMAVRRDLSTRYDIEVVGESIAP